MDGVELTAAPPKLWEQGKINPVTGILLGEYLDRGRVALQHLGYRLWAVMDECPNGRHDLIAGTVQDEGTDFLKYIQYQDNLTAYNIWLQERFRGQMIDAVNKTYPVRSRIICLRFYANQFVGGLATNVLTILY